jgi:hypothetical protein
LKSEGEEYLGQTNNGDTVESLETHLRQHFEFENQVEVGLVLKVFFRYWFSVITGVICDDCFNQIESTICQFD